MISVILYGRNDHHGYNYPKRLAISINCIAAVLYDPDDEILFVDYNSEDGLPTVIETIQDTLTEKAKKRLKTYRVRKGQHSQFKDPKLPLLEPVARNVALRRSNPNNKWILSTNPDMIFIPKNGSLSSIVSKLQDGFYLLPRFSIPEHLWELSLDRSDPEKNLSILRSYSQKLHLHTTVRRSGFLQYDNPGDFQLALREDLFAIGGFDEEMRNGWHVDSNLSKRMALLGRSGISLEGELLAFHCNHNYAGSPTHKTTLSNDWGRFVDRVSSPKLSKRDWGLADEAVEEVVLGQGHLSSLVSILSGYSEKTYDLLISFDTFNRQRYHPSRIFAYLADYLVHIPKETDVGYLGYNPELVRMIGEYLKGRGHVGKIIELLDQRVSLNDKMVFIADFGFDAEGQEIHYREGRKKLKKVVRRFIEISGLRRKAQLPTAFIGVNVLHTDVNILFSTHLLTRSNGHSTGVIYGELPLGREKRPKTLFSWVHYYVVRYLFEFTDPIRTFVVRNILKPSGPSNTRSTLKV